MPLLQGGSQGFESLRADHMKEKDWETKLQEAIVALQEAHKAMDEFAGWSGSSGNWVLHTALPQVEQALRILKPVSNLKE